MKKNLLLLSLFVGGSLLAQHAIHSTNATAVGKGNIHPTTNQRANPGSNSASTTIFSEDFGSGLPGTWSIVNNNPTPEVWHYTTTGSFNPGGQLNPMGTTAANGYMIFDSDSSGSAGNPENCDLITPSINCTGHSTVYLSLNQYYREYQLDSCLIGVSTDNVNWTYIYTPDTAVNPNTSDTPNPDHLIFDISSIAGNQATVYVKFHYSGDWDYYWLIDDVSLFVPNTNDLAGLHANGVSPEYTMVPLQQAANITLTGLVRNLGSTTLTGTTAKFEVVDTVSNAVVFTNIVSVPTLAPLASAAVSSNYPFAATTTGYFRTRLTAISTGDMDGSNDVNNSFEVLHVTDTVYARDNDVSIGQLGIGAGPANGIVGQNFKINANDQLTSVSFFLTDMTFNPAGTPVYVTIHPQGPGVEPGASIASTDSLIVTTGTIAPGGQWFTLNMHAGPLPLTPGLYYAGVHEVDSILTLSTSAAIFTPRTVWVSWNTIPTPPAVNGWATADDFNFNITYQLRLNLGPNPMGIPVNEEATTVALYPNPTSGMLSVGTGANGRDNVTVSVFDATGARVYFTQTSNPEIKIDLSAKAAGVYFVQINNGTSVINKKINITN